MTQNHQAPNDPRTEDLRPEANLNIDRPGVIRRLSAVDAILIAGIAFGGYLASAHAGEPSNTTRLEPIHNPQQNQFCSDEELRHMRAGLDSCTDNVRQVPRPGA